MFSIYSTHYTNTVDTTVVCYKTILIVISATCFSNKSSESGENIQKYKKWLWLKYLWFLLLWIQQSIGTHIYRTIILPVVLYGCETWSLILREERKLRVFEENIWA